VDEARRRRAEKNGGQALHVSMGQIDGASREKPLRDVKDLVALDDALQALSDVNARAARIVELRFFGGLTVEETAEVLGASARTVAREWRFAQAWLFRELRADAPVGNSANSA
jgi:RNA polymerase sigma factor (TIGR02999 family)